MMEENDNKSTGVDVKVTNGIQSVSTCLPDKTPQSPPPPLKSSVIDHLLINEKEQQVGEGLVPNFRVEGSGCDSSVTVALASLTTSALHLNGEDLCGSGLSLQSEEMKLSLVSWYSEPDDPSTLTTSSTSSCCEGGRQAISMTGSINMTKSGSEEKENQTPEPLITTPQDSRESVSTLQEEECKNNSKNQQRHKVQLLEQKNTPATPQSACKITKNGRENSCEKNKGGRPECPRCTRRSKSGSTTPHQQSRTGNRRLISCTKSSTELKKPIKSILKQQDSRSGGSGSDNNKSSMDSLGSADLRPMSTPLQGIMTRSDSSNRAKFNLNHEIFNDNCLPSTHSTCPPRLRTIEKYATLRLRKGPKGRALDLGSDTAINTNGKGVPQQHLPDIMTKSMSFLEKSSLPTSLPYSANTPSTTNYNTASLKRQGSLRLKKGPSPHWEPCTTRTTALRMQKMQEAKAKGTNGHIGLYSAGSGSVHTASTHSGSGDSIHHLPSQHHHASNSHSAPPKMSTKVFTKLSSSLYGQTASSNQKRLKQDKSCQTEPEQIDSPLPAVDPVTATSTSDLLLQIKQLKKLANRYRNTALRFQSEHAKSEARIQELTKQLKETQIESNEMVEFLQAEKNTLAETLSEFESEAKKWRQQNDTKDSNAAEDARIS